MAFSMTRSAQAAHRRSWYSRPRLQLAAMQAEAAKMDPAMLRQFGLDPAQARQAAEDMKRLSPKDLARQAEEARGCIVCYCSAASNRARSTDAEDVSRRAAPANEWSAGAVAGAA